MKAVHASLVSIGYEPDRQNLVPHLTLGRIKEITDKKNFQSVVDTFRDLSSGEMPVREFVLYESILKKEGPIYIPLKRFELNLLAAE
jgi:2'-5' RNA ligase